MLVIYIYDLQPDYPATKTIQTNFPKKFLKITDDSVVQILKLDWKICGKFFLVALVEVVTL